MASALKRMAGYLGLMDQEEVNDSGSSGSSGLNQNSFQRSLPQSDSQPTVKLSRRERRAVSVVPSSNSNTNANSNSAGVLDHIVSVSPRMYSEARVIGEHFRSGKPVIMNLSDMEEAERYRLVDFASGLVFGHFGSIERVTPKVFLLTPPNVKVSVEDKTSAAAASFFNQS
jgi:cell division inhibitor SepF